MKNILKRLNIFAMLIAIVSNVFVVTPIAAEHEHVGVALGVPGYWYEVVDDTYHTELSGFDEICSCGEVIKKIIISQTNEEHSFKGGVCKYCQYTTEHTHKGAYQTMVTLYESQNENVHMYYIGWESRCDCGANLGIVEENFTVEPHLWMGDTCAQCKYTRTQTHTHKGVTKGNKVTTLKSSDETTHTYVTAYENLCSCGESVGLIDETTTTTKHNFKNDKCTECGYTKSHTHKGVTKGKAVTSLKSYDEKTHTYVTAYENLCSCGESVGLIDETTNTANHSFKDDKCTECGYIIKNPVKDEQSILGDFFEDANVDGVAAQITVGEIPDSGLVVEVSSLLASKNIVGANLPELVPLIGSLKYSDEVYTVVKNADDLENIIENANGFYEIARAVVIRKDEA